MKTAKLFLLIIVLFLVAGCSSSTYLPMHSMKLPEQAVSLPDLSTLEKRQVEYITTFTGILDPGLLDEVIKVGGVFPAVARKPLGQLIFGYGAVVPTPEGDLPLNAAGDILIQFVFEARVSELAQTKILYFNRDAGWAYNLVAGEVKDGKKEMEPDYEPVEYDPKQFDKSDPYREKLFARFGLSLDQIDKFWSAYSHYYDIPYGGNIYEVRVGSKDWDSYKTQVEKLLPNKFETWTGEVRVTYLNLEDFGNAATVEPGFTGPGRWIKRATIPITVGAAFTGVPLVLFGAIIAGDVAGAGIDTSWSGYYGRAKTIRHALAPAFRTMATSYKNKLKAANDRIRELESERRLVSRNP